MFKQDNKILRNLDSFFHVFHTISDFVFIMDVDEEGDFRYLFVNEPAMQFTGLKEDAIGKRIEDVMPQQAADIIIRQYQNAIQKKESLTYEDYRMSSLEYTNLDINPGHVVYFETKITPFFDDQGICTLIVAIVRDITSRKRKEIELITLKDRYQSLFEYNFNGIYSVDLQGMITSVNPALEKMTGFTAEELMGKPIVPFIVPDDIEHIIGCFQKAANGETQQYESAIYHKDGRIIYLSVINVPIFIEGQIVGVYGMVIDQTESKAAEKALKDSEERYRRLVEMSPDGIVVHREGKILYANPSAISSMNGDNPVGKSIFSYIHPDYHERIRERIIGANIGGKMPNIEIKMIHNRGELIYADFGGMSILYDGKPAMMTLFRDVTERKLAIRALKESEEKYRLIADNMTDLIRIVDTHGMIKYASPSHQLVFGQSPAEYEGTVAFEYVHPNERIDVENQLMQMISAKQSKTVEFRHKHSKGNWIWVEAKAAPVFDDKGHIDHILVIAREITRRKALEEQLTFMAYHDTLTGLPNRRLFKARLEQSIKEANLEQRKIALLYMDIDSFKRINDTLGHDIGDECIIQFAQRVKGCIRESDLFARLGGDEFCALLEISHEQDAIDNAQKIIAVLQNQWTIGKHEFVATSSIGIAFYEEGFTGEALIKAADIALYQAKEKGRNNYQIYETNK